MSNDESIRVETLERRVAVLSRYVHASLSLKPIQAAEFEAELERAVAPEPATSLDLCKECLNLFDTNAMYCSKFPAQPAPYTCFLLCQGNSHVRA